MPAGSARRLALAVGATIVAAFPGGVWFVELAATGATGAVGRAVLKALGTTETPGVAPADVAAVELGDAERSLVILDNCEHLVDECAVRLDGAATQSEDQRPGHECASSSG